MLKINRNTIFIDYEKRDRLIQESLKTFNEINDRSKRGRANYIVVSEQIAKEINKLQTNYIVFSEQMVKEINKLQWNKH